MPLRDARATRYQAVTLFDGGNVLRSALDEAGDTLPHQSLCARGGTRPLCERMESHVCPRPNDHDQKHALRPSLSRYRRGTSGPPIMTQGGAVRYGTLINQRAGPPGRPGRGLLPTAWASSL